LPVFQILVDAVHMVHRYHKINNVVKKTFAPALLLLNTCKNTISAYEKRKHHFDKKPGKHQIDLEGK